MWSKELTKLSREYFETGFCNVKNKVPEFGVLIKKDNQFRIKLFNSDTELIYNSVDDLINAGWVVD
ncbi:MAG: hypothetical protein LBK13_09025 [Spirochaetales bacterium]|jgi:hypothetical protein|nr:hypothetical protein [Spirochaetales bacterium]